MDAPWPILLLEIQNNQWNFLEAKNYQIPYQDDTYKLIMTTFPKQAINLDIKQAKNLVFKYSHKEYSFKYITNTLLLAPQHYKNFTNELNFLDRAINNKSLIINKVKDNKGSLRIFLTIKK